jgi:hypothetical protein
MFVEKPFDAAAGRKRAPTWSRRNDGGPALAPIRRASMREKTDATAQAVLSDSPAP